MRFMPRTLFGRTALFMALLITAANLSIFSVLRLVYIENVRQTLVSEISGTITLAQTTLQALPPDQRAAFLSRTYVNGGRIVTSAAVPATVDFSRPRRPLAAAVEAAIHQPILIGTDPDKQDLWIGFKAGSDGYWFVLPYGHFSEFFPFIPLIWTGVLLLCSVIGAYLVIFGLGRQLRSVINAARAIGRGESPEPLAVKGPQEIRELSRGFNQMAEGLRRLDAERRLMLAGISHDVRSPLARLRLGVEMLAGKRDTAIAENMILDIEEMDAIITQFLDYARDGQEEEPRQGDLNQIALEVCARYEATGAQIGKDLGALPAFNFRKLAVRRMLANLLDNSVRYGGKNVLVTTRHLSGKVQITVADRGPGIQDADAANLIKPFVRGNPSRGDQYGAGLGLAIADRIARLHGGELSLANREGGGLQVKVEIPVASPHSAWIPQDGR